jgi:uncharacterized glyoxalase superfamily protein PhnB
MMVRDAHPTHAARKTFMKSHKPADHNAVSPYLLVKDVKGTLNFLSSSLGAVEIYKMELADGSIKHAEVRIDDSVVMMGERPASQESIHCSVHVYVPNVDESYRKALAAGAQSISEPRDMPYGDRSAGVKDQEGNLWWLGTHLGPAAN